MAKSDPERPEASIRAAVHLVDCGDQTWSARQGKAVGDAGAASQLGRLQHHAPIVQRCRLIVAITNATSAGAKNILVLVDASACSHEELLGAGQHMLDGLDDFSDGTNRRARP
jgi:hypothetical protein